LHDSNIDIMLLHILKSISVKEARSRWSWLLDFYKSAGEPLLGKAFAISPNPKYEFKKLSIFKRWPVDVDCGYSVQMLWMPMNVGIDRYITLGSGKSFEVE